MKQSVQLQIPQPCHENWDNMTRMEQGRYCNACSKTVVDFSMMTDQQILDYLGKTGAHICARVETSQLGRDIKPMPVPPKTSWWMALLMPLLLLFERAGAQRKNVLLTGKPAVKNTMPVKVGELAVPQSRRLSTSPKEIYGTVRDEKGSPIPYAIVRITDGGNGVTADEQGNYKLTLPAMENDSVLISFSCLGYGTSELHVAGTGTIQKDVVLPQWENKLNDVTVISYGREVGRIIIGGAISVTKTNIIKDTIAAILPKPPSFSVAPNPVQRNQQFTVLTRELDDYTIQIINNSGIMVHAQLYRSSKNIVQYISVPSSWVPGIYYVRLVDEKTKRQRTEKMLVM